MTAAGNAILPASAAGLAVRPGLHDRIVAAGLAIMDAVNEQLTFAHPENPEISECRHVVFTTPAEGGQPARAAVAIHPGWVDRSPCGTGNILVSGRPGRESVRPGDQPWPDHRPGRGERDRAVERRGRAAAGLRAAGPAAAGAHPGHRAGPGRHPAQGLRG